MSAGAATAMKSERKVVLVVDGDWETAHATTCLIETHHEVIISHSYQGAVELVSELELAAVITDLDLGSRDTGVDLLQLVARYSPSARRILYTRLPQLQPSVAHRVLQKPSGAAALLAAIDE